VALLAVFSIEQTSSSGSRSQGERYRKILVMEVRIPMTQTRVLLLTVRVSGCLPTISPSGKNYKNPARVSRSSWFIPPF